MAKGLKVQVGQDEELGGPVCFHENDMAGVEMVLNARSVLAYVLSTISQPKGGDALSLEGDALFGFHLVLEGVANTLEAAMIKGESGKFLIKPQGR